MEIEQIKVLYTHHLELYQKRRWTATSGLFNLELCRLYGYKLIKDGHLTKEQHEIDLLPVVDMADLFGTKSRITDDGEE